MSLPYAYTPQIWPPVFTALALVALAVYSFRRRSVPGALPFTFALLFGALWMVGTSLEVAAVDTSAKIFWVKFQATWLLPSATAVTCFLLEYAWPGRWLTRRNLALLSIPCLLAFGMILTNDLHHLFWQRFTVDGEVILLRGPVNWIFLVYAYGLTIVNLVVLVWLFIRSPQHRWPVVLMLAGQIGARVVYALDALGVIHSNLPIEAFAFWFPIPMYVIALFAFRIFDPIPLARQVVIEQLRDGMLVLDPQRRVVSLNPAAEPILGAPLKHVKGKPVGDLLPGFLERGSPLTGATAFSKPFEMNISLRGEARCYELDFSPLHDFRGLPIGDLLLLHDVTEQKRVQAQILEQQRSLAMLHEREQLARELHDSTGQVLGYAGFQLEAVQDLIRDGQAALSGGQAEQVRIQLAEAENQLARLSHIVEEAHADVREYILNLRLAHSDQRPFFATLQRYLDGFSQNYAIQTALVVEPGVEEGMFNPETQMQLFRIIQEGLSNARKHAQAGFVQVSFEVQVPKICIYIQDNGRGFEPGQAAKDGGKHFGLGFMRERAEALGGVLRVDSAPGEGTRVEVEVPCGS